MSMSTTHGNAEVSDEQILTTFLDIEGPFVTAGELEERLPITRTAINKRLNKLHKQGRVDRKKPTSNMVGWWLDQG
jgi:predicted transcriptional regulator